jgi:hypothetical protein
MVIAAAPDAITYSIAAFVSGDLAGARVANIGIHHRHGQHPRHDRGLHTRCLRLVD